MAQTSRDTRRDFLGKLATGWVALVLLPAVYVIIEYVFPPADSDLLTEAIPVGSVSELARGEGRIVRVGKRAIALARTEDGQVKAYSALCTHLGCVLQYLPGEHRFHCNCHGSEFSLDGQNLSGPAPVPLQSRRVELRKNEIFVAPS